MKIWDRWLEIYRRRRWLLKGLLMALLPLLCCVISSASQGRSIGQVYLPSSEWNDELFYFKQVEGILEYGYPYGYFGFNESHALKLSFAAWSPVLVFPWLLWGLIFGWNLMSPIYCNIFLMMLSMFLFVVLTRPSNKQLGILTILFCLFTPFTRYMMSGMPEVICFSLLICFYALSVNYLKGEKGFKLALLFVLSGLLTLMRPYMVVFMLLPAWLWFRRRRWLGAAGSAAVLAATGIVYAAVKHYFGAEYFTPLFDTTWVTTFLDQGIFAGIKYVLWRLLHAGKNFMGMSLEGFRSGLAAGAFFSGFLTIMVILLLQSWADLRKKRKDELLLNGHLFLSFAAMLAALLLMYKMTEGSKHLLTFIAAGIFAVSRMDTRFYKKAMLAGAVFAYLYTYKAIDPYDYQVPYRNEERVAMVEEWRTAFDQQLVLQMEAVPRYDNVAIWTFSDETPEGVRKLDWQLLYALPKGFGISCCYSEYVTEHFQELRSRYLAAPAGGKIDDMCYQAGFREVGRIGGNVVYDRNEVKNY